MLSLSFAPKISTQQQRLTTHILHKPRARSHTGWDPEFVEQRAMKAKQRREARKDILVEPHFPLCMPASLSDLTTQLFGGKVLEAWCDDTLHCSLSRILVL